MAKYVMLEFPDDSSADDFVKQMLERDTHGMPFVPQSGRIRGLWKKPTLFCGCTAVKRRGWTRGKKYGWFICSQCHKPSRLWGKGDAWYTALGTNLLPIAEGASEYRGPDHKSHPGYNTYELTIARAEAGEEQLTKLKED